MEDLELVYKVKENNDDEALLDLIEIYTPMIYSIINNYELDCGDYLVAKDDLYQEGTIGLYDACKRFENNLVAKFSTFAYIVIKRRLNKVYYRLYYPYRKESVSFDRMDLVDHFSKMGYQVAEKEYEYNGIMKNVLNSNLLTEEDKEIIRLRLENYSYKEIAKIQGINVKRVDNRITRLKKIIKNNKEGL